MRPPTPAVNERGTWLQRHSGGHAQGEGGHDQGQRGMKANPGDEKQKQKDGTGGTGQQIQTIGSNCGGEGHVRIIPYAARRLRRRTSEEDRSES